LEEVAPVTISLLLGAIYRRESPFRTTAGGRDKAALMEINCAECNFYTR